MYRRSFLAASLALPLSGVSFAASAELPNPDPLGFTPDPDFVERATALLRRTPAADLHAHPGRTFARRAETSPDGGASDHADGAFEDQAAADLKAGLVSVASFASVSDAPVLGVTPTGISVVRPFAPGEAFSAYQKQVANLNAIAKRDGMTLVQAPHDLGRLAPGKDVGMFLTVEGGDFLEGDTARLARAFGDGVRAITLIHYRPNELGDNQTSPPAHGGLSKFGVTAVREMQRLGIVIDVAHAAETTVRDVLKSVTTPVMCSHSVLKTPAFDHPRFISADIARAVAAAGGVVGVWPSGFGATRLSDYIDRIFQLADVVGPDHVAFGTDMDGNYKPVLTSYRQVPLVISELLRRGYGERNAEKFAGGNFRRLWTDVWRARAAAQG